MVEIEIAKSGQIREGAVFATTAGGHALAATRVAGKIQVFENKCPHLGLSLTRGKIADGTITCPFHNSRFDICSGRNLDWVSGFMGKKTPAWTHGLIALGKSPAGLKTFPASERDGAVYVGI